jgi:hypothetical protein
VFTKALAGSSLLSYHVAGFSQAGLLSSAKAGSGAAALSIQKIKG